MNTHPAYERLHEVERERDALLAALHAVQKILMDGDRFTLRTRGELTLLVTRAITKATEE